MAVADVLGVVHAMVRKGVNVELEGYGGLENDMLESHNGLNDDWGGSRK